MQKCLILFDNIEKSVFLTIRSSSSLLVEAVTSSLAGVLMGWCCWRSAATMSLCLLNLSITCVSLARLVRITSLASVLLFELISNIVYKEKESVYYRLNRLNCDSTERHLCWISTVTHWFGFVAFDGIDYLKAVKLHFLQTRSWNKKNRDCYQVLH